MNTERGRKPTASHIRMTDDRRTDTKTGNYMANLHLHSFPLSILISLRADGTRK